MISQRGYKILMSLIENNETILIEDLAKNFNVSERAIRYDLDGIDYYLKYSNFPMLIRKQNQGVSYKIDYFQLETLKSNLNEYIKTFSIMSPNQRLLEITLRLVTSTEPIKLEIESEKIGVSKSTLFKDFEKIKEIFNGKDMTVMSSKRGYEIVGNENHVCFKTAKIFLNYIESEDLIEIMKFMLFDGVEINLIFDRIFNENTKPTILQIMQSISSNYKFSDENYLFACFSISLALARKIDISVESDFVNSLKNIITSLEFAEKDFDVSSTARSLIANVDKLIGSRFIEDIVLISAVQTEMLNIFSKLGDVNFQITEMEQLIAVNEHLYLAIEISAKKNEELNSLKKVINKAEIAKILLHFVEALDRRLYFVVDKPKVVILSPFDKSMSHMIEERILSYFDVEVIALGDLKEISQIINKEEIDFVISTYQVYFDNIITIVINPLVSNIDISNLKKILPTRVVDIFVLKKINDFSKQYVSKEDFPNYILGVKKILNIKTREKIEEE